jgi:branched-chain amino acid transport system substrate-binding protein
LHNSQTVRLRRLLLPAIVTLSAILASCAPNEATVAPTGDPINVGAVISLTGSQATGGQMAKEGYLYCQNWINGKGGVTVQGVGHPLNIDIVDDQSRPSIAGAMTEQLIAQHHTLLLGGSNDATAYRSAQVAEQHQVPMVSSGASSDGIFNNNYRYVFSVLAPDSRQLQGVIDMALTLNPRPQSVAVLFASDSISTEVAYATAGYAQAKGLAVTYGGSYPTGVNDLRDELGAAAGSGPDLLLEVGHPSESVRTIQQAQQMNIQPKLFGFSSGPGNSSFVSSLHKTANYSFGTTQWSPSAHNPRTYFLDSFHYATGFASKFGHLPDEHAAAATAACLTLEVAIEQANSLLPYWVRDSLGVIDMKTFFGEISFDSRGINQAKPVYVQQVQAGQTVLVWPPQVATSRPRYPDPGWAKR